MERVSAKGGHLAQNTGHIEGAGHTLEELKPPHTKALPAELAPLATRELLDLIGANRASEQIRLHAPKAADPFQSRSSGTKRDYLLLQKAIQKAGSEVSDALVTRLQYPIDGVSEQALGFMRASLAREHNMLELLKGLTDSMGRVHHRVVGSQEG